MRSRISARESSLRFIWTLSPMFTRCGEVNMPGLCAAGAQNALYHGAHGTLAVRARHMDYRIFQVRVPERLRKLPDPVQREFRPRVAQVANEVEGGLEVGKTAALCRYFRHNQTRNSTTGRAICKEE